MMNSMTKKTIYNGCVDRLSLKENDGIKSNTVTCSSLQKEYTKKMVFINEEKTLHYA